MPNVFALAEQVFGINLVKIVHKQSPLKSVKSYSEIRDRMGSRSLKTSRKSAFWSSKSSKSLSSMSSQNKKLSSAYTTFESYFKNTYPWQSIFVDEKLDKSIEEVNRLAIKVIH